MPLQIGDSLGRYTLLKRLASGGMGEVYLAAKAGPVGFGPRVALKILRDELASDQQFVDMLVDEANISMFLNHQNVVSVLDLAEDNGTYYIAMEFVQGVTVEHILERLIAQGRKLDLALGLYVSQELCRALKYAHTRVNHAGEPLNIIHRDVTPANILLSIQGEVKLTDFGIARAKGRIHHTQAGVLKGKFGYMAPEMIRYEEIDARADLFCAGVVIYLMLTGRHPVSGATVMEAIQRFEDKQIPKPSQVNPEVPTTLDQIVMRALEPKPDNRWASAAALGAALQDVVLKNPAWRREVQDGATRLADLMREISSEAFQDPIPADLAGRILKDALAREGEVIFRPESTTSSMRDQPLAASGDDEGGADTIKPPTGPVPRPVMKRANSGPVTDRSAQALGEDTFNSKTSEGPVPAGFEELDSKANGEFDLPFMSDPPMVANPELETEEGLALADVYAARDELSSEYERAKEQSRLAAAALESERRDPSSGVSLKKSGPKPLPKPDTGDLARAPEQDPIESSSDEIPTGLAPVEKTVAFDSLAPSSSAARMNVEFPDSSTDRHRLHDEMMEEQELPAKNPEPAGANGSGKKAPVDDGRTVVGMMPLPSLEPNLGVDIDEHRSIADALEEPELGPVNREPSQVDDGKTVAGMQIPNWDAPSDEFRAPIIAEVEMPVRSRPEQPARKGRIDPEVTRAYSALDVLRQKDAPPDLDDAETVIPLGDEGHEIDPDEWLASRGTEVEDASLKNGDDANDQTLLDGIDPRAVKDAIRKKMAVDKKQRPTVLKTPDQAREDKRTKPIDTEEDTPAVDGDGVDLDLDGIIAESFKTGRAPAPVGKGQTGPQLLDGPVRIRVGQDGQPVLGPGANVTEESVAQSPLGVGSAAAALAANAQGAEVKRKPPAPRERRPVVKPAAGGSAPTAVPAKDPEVGAQTGRWMAGEIDAAQLEWDDDAAARRAVATRNKAAAIGPSGRPPQHSPNAGTPMVVPGQPAPPSVSVMGTGVRFPGGMVAPDGRIVPPPSMVQPAARSWMPIIALVAACVAVAVVFGVLFFSRVLWPKLKLESEPPGATVIVDDIPAENVAPVTVRVEPERAHIIEYRLDGYRTERREISDGVGRGRTYTLQVTLRRILPVLDIRPVEGSVTVNGQKVGRGSRVSLANLPKEGEVKIRVQAEGYQAWEASFERPSSIPESLDVALLKLEPPPPPKKR
jgi:protein kinase-like protein